MLSADIFWEIRKADLKIHFYNSIGWDCPTDFGLFIKMHDPTFRIPYMWKELLNVRSVTVASDEPICGAILMDFDFGYLMEGTDIEERMKRFWEMHGKIGIPIPLLFVPGPKLKTTGFCWAPASLIPCAKTGPGMDTIGAVKYYSWIQNKTLRLLTGRFFEFLNLGTLSTTKCLAMHLPPRKAFLLKGSEKHVTIDLPCTLNGQKYFIRKAPDNTNADF